MMNRPDPLYEEAVRRMGAFLSRVRRVPLREPAAFALTTATPVGRPSTRMVLLKSFDRQGFVFYTNLSSRKGRELARNPWSALCFYLDGSLEQVRVEGKARPVSAAEADAYWKSRHRDSQISSAASRQSKTLGSRAQLLAEARRLKAEFKGKDIPRPAHWSGLRVAPVSIEFWKAGPHRLNHREIYEKKGPRWSRRLLYP